MQTRNRLLDDLARVAAGALGIAAGARREAEEMLRLRLGAVLDRQGLVTREEFDAVKAMVVKARAENEALEKRVAALEAALAAKPRRARKPRARGAGAEEAGSGEPGSDESGSDTGTPGPA